MRKAEKLLLDTRGSAAVEFALVAPILILLTLAALDLASLMFDYHRASEATRRAARVAAIEAPIPDISGLEAPEVYTCRWSGGGPTCTGAGVINGASFDKILADARAILPTLAPENLFVEYRASGVGSVDTPAGILPLITVRLAGAERSLELLRGAGFPSLLNLPEFASSHLGNGK
jgi:hypothetical protein